MQLSFILFGTLLSVVCGQSPETVAVWGNEECSSLVKELQIEQDKQRVLNLVDICRRVVSKESKLACPAPAKICDDLGVNVTELRTLNEKCLMNRTPGGHIDERCEKICLDERKCRKPLSCSCGLCRLECVAERVCGEKEFNYYFEIYKQLAEFDLNADANFDSCKELHQYKYNVSNSTSEPPVTNTGDEVEIAGQEGAQSGDREGTTPKTATVRKTSTKSKTRKPRDRNVSGGPTHKGGNKTSNSNIRSRNNGSKNGKIHVKKLTKQAVKLDL